LAGCGLLLRPRCLLGSLRLHSRNVALGFLSSGTHHCHLHDPRDYPG
jgi:hypothetical protein